MVPRRLYLTSRGEVIDPDTVQLNQGLEDMSLEEEGVSLHSGPHPRELSVKKGEKDVSFYFILKNFYFYIYFWLCWIFVALRAFL